MKKASLTHIMHMQRRKSESSEHESGHESGQVLLILVLITSILLTIGLSTIESTVVDNKNTKLTEDGKRAEAAAEAGLDAAIDSGTDISGTDFSNLFRTGTDISGSATDTSSTSTTFDTPTIAKDQSYTFYLSGYNPATETITGTFTSAFNIARLTPATNDCGGTGEMAVELTIVSTSTGILGRQLIDPCNITGGGIDTIAFSSSINVNTLYGAAAHLLFVRVIATSDSFPGATFRLTRETGGNWPAQGRNIVSTAQTAGGVTKTVTLFTSYPQIPADFFVMSL